LIADLEAARGDLARAEREAGTLAERQRIAGELHDTVTQDLVSIVRLLESAEGALALSPERAAGDVRRARAAAPGALDQARRLLWSMRPDLLEKERLPGALRRAVGSFERDTGVAARLVVEAEEVALPPDLEVALLRSAQEALANVKKHA